jgi:pimeloyl-ACP methyl ester carboxylesterase
MADWGPFYASYGIVTVITNTGGGDFPAIRAQKLMAALEEIKKLNDDPSSPIGGKLAGRYGTSGYSMGGGGTTITARDNPTLKTSIGLAAWSPTGARVQVPTLLMCGTSDGVAACSQSEGAYREIPDTTPKMLIAISGATHFSWFSPTGAGRGISGQYALAFQKVFLEGDERWRPFLLQSSSGADVTTNIQ